MTWSVCAYPAGSYGLAFTPAECLTVSELQLEGNFVDVPLEDPLEERIDRSNRRRGGIWKRSAAFATSLATAVGMTLGGAVPATAAPEDDAEALGKFLGGEVLGVNLDDIVEVGSAYAEFPYGEYPTVTHPLNAEVLNALRVDLGDTGLQLLGNNGIIELGAVNQFAKAQHIGDASAASGAVNNQGAVGVGGSDEYAANATVDLGNVLSLLPGENDDLVEELSLELGALSSSIEQVDGEPVDMQTQSDYGVANVTLNLESPAVQRIYVTLQGTVNELQDTVNGLGGTLTDSVSDLLTQDLGSLANLETDIEVTAPDLSAILTDETIGSTSGVTVNLSNGQVTVDLERLLAANEDLPNLNQLDANESLLQGRVLAAITDGVTQAISDVVTTVVEELREAVEATSLDINVDLTVLDILPWLPPTAGIQVDITADLEQILAGEVDGAANTRLTGLASVLQPILDALGLGQGSELGDLVLNLIGGTLGDTLDILGELEPVVDEITGPLATDVVGPVLEVTNQVVSLRVNVQPETGDLGPASSTVRAAQLTLLPTLQTPLAQVDLASSTVRGTAVELDPSIELDPTAVQAGDWVGITGEGFYPESELTIDIFDAEGSQEGAVSGVSSDEEGNFEDLWTIPADFPGAETLTVTVTDNQGNSATETFNVYDPSLTADPFSAAPGESIELDGLGFVPNSRVIVEISNDDGVIATFDPADVEVDGSFSVVWDDAPLGEFTVTATDIENDRIFASTDVTVEESGDDADATDGTDSDVGDDADAVDADAVDADADAADTDAADADADADGVDADVDAADADATDTDATDADATDADAADTDAADADATDTDAADADGADTDATDGGDEQPEYSGNVSVDPSDVEAGNPVTVNGDDFAPNSVVDIVITDAEGNEVATIEGVEVDDNGAFSTDWDVPADTDAGTYTVTATDTESPEISGSEELTVSEASGSDADTTDGNDADVADAGDIDATDADATDATDATDSDGTDTDSDAVDADADVADTDSADTEATDVDADVTDGTDADSDVVDADADATHTDADTDAVDTDATDIDAADTDAADADATDADADATDATDGGDEELEYSGNVSVEPTDVVAGNPVTVTGDDFAPNSVVDVVVTDADGNEIATIEGVEVDDNGEFSTDWDVPADTDAGTYTVTATDTETPEISGSAEVTVTESSDADTDTDATDGVDADAADADATDADGTDADADADADGANADATDGDDADETDPSINVDPETAAPGEDITIEGDDFGPEENVTIEITDEDGNVVDTITVVTDDDGDFSVTWTVPQDVTPGTLTITAADESGNSATAQLTISATGTGAGTADSGDGLASTGAKATMIATAVALLLIVIGAGLLIARRNNTVNDAS